MQQTLDENSCVRTGRCSIICLARCARRILPVRERKGERAFALALGDASEVGQGACARIDNLPTRNGYVAAWWSVTSTGPIRKYWSTRDSIVRNLGEAKIFSSFFFQHTFLLGYRLDRSTESNGSILSLALLVSLINSRIVETVLLFCILKLYSKICENDYYLENIVSFFFFSFAFLLGKSKL